MQKFKQIFLANITDEPDPEEADQYVAHFFGALEIKDKKWRNRIITRNTLFTADELAVAVQLSEEAKTKGEETSIPLEQLLKGQAHLETKIQMVDANLIDPSEILICPRPHRKYGGLLRRP